MNLVIIILAKYLYLLIIAMVGLFVFFSSNIIKKEIFKVSIFSLPLSFILLKILAFLYYDPRPFVVSHLQPLIAHAADNGFPSDHTTLCASLASIVFVFNRKLGYFLFFLTFLVGGSRVLASVHHPIDILGGFIVGICSVLVVSSLLSNKP